MTFLQSIVPGLARSTPNAKVEADAKIRPAFNIREDVHGYNLTVFLPGVPKENLEITDHDDLLTIAGRRAWTQPKEWTALYRETSRANFELVLRHEGDIDVEKINAELKDGRLQLMLPKAEAAKPRKIAIN